MKRIFIINKEQLNLTKATKLKIDKKMLSLEEYQENKWRLTFSSKLIENFKNVENIIINDNSIELEGTDIILNLKKKTLISSTKKIITIEQNKRGDFILFCSNQLIKDIKELKKIFIIRED